MKLPLTCALVLCAACSSGNATAPVSTHNVWTSKASMPTPRFRLGVGVVNGVLYAVGGCCGGGSPASLTTVEAYDPSTDTWTTKAFMPTPRMDLGVGVVNGILYAVGGVLDAGIASGGSVRTVEAYDPSTDTWTTKAPITAPLDGLGVGVVNGILYAVGDGGGSGDQGTVEAYDPSTDTWTTKAPMPTKRQYLGVGVANGILYAMGGYLFAGGGYAGYAKPLEAYDPSTDTWTTKASMPTPRTGPGVGVLNGVLYAVGGGDLNTAQGLNAVEAYDPSTDTWTPKASMPTPRTSLAVGVVNNVLYAVGGDRAGGTVEAYQP